MICFIRIFGFILCLGAIGGLDYCAEAGVNESPLSWLIFGLGCGMMLISFLIRGKE